MNNFNSFLCLMEQYLLKHNYDNKLKTTIEEASFSSEKGESLCHSDLEVIDMDRFAKKGYRKIILSNSISEDDSINTADAFLINKDNEWYFVEFKLAKISNSKHSVLKKAYSNAYAVMDVLYSMRDTEFSYEKFDYSNPIKFLQDNAKYILVFSEKENPQHVIQMQNHLRKNEKYLPEFMARLQGYIYKEAFAVTETVFENTFVKKFTY